MSESSVKSEVFFVPEAGDRPCRLGRRLDATAGDEDVAQVVEATQKNVFAFPATTYHALAKKPADSYLVTRKRDHDLEEEREEQHGMQPIEEDSGPEFEASYYDSDVERHSLRHQPRSEDIMKREALLQK